jgi:hypothetical protein
MRYTAAPSSRLGARAQPLHTSSVEHEWLCCMPVSEFYLAATQVRLHVSDAALATKSTTFLSITSMRLGAHGRLPAPSAQCSGLHRRSEGVSRGSP